MPAIKLYICTFKSLVSNTLAINENTCTQSVTK